MHVEHRATPPGQGLYVSQRLRGQERTEGVPLARDGKVFDGLGREDHEAAILAATLV